ncbi:TonB-dependent receptor [Foetidibacter luteolus]|uniref:TonB-dependent receptor n=1 Tax=Foetidibacter luteolus TaxID=2608880 RepID=UPI00129B8091|nr:TonB-dependent receptor [Foetidibacter luteolus]
MNFPLRRPRAFGFTCSSRFIRVHFLVIAFLLVKLTATAQQPDSLQFIQDSAVLDSITVTAFAVNTTWKEVPAAVAIINRQQLQRLDNVSLVPVMNTVAGVRMEERSPGSYRLSIRGSLLRSPFGVRNVKLYWDNIPFTDAGGNTYMQLVDMNQLSSVEVVKGPAGSLYGANTGGAVILHPQLDADSGSSFEAAISGGSYGLFNEQLRWSNSGAKFSSNLQQSHMQSDGYRQQSRMRRDAVKWAGEWRMSNKTKLSALAVYTDLFYQTPGGLTQRQMDSAPAQARVIAIQQKAAIYNKTAFTGFTLSASLAPHFDNTTTVTVSHTSFRNPFTSNYEKRNEWNYGGRTAFSYHIEKGKLRLQWLNGAEWQQNYSQIDNYDNNGGIAGNVQYKDALYATQYFLFTQLNVNLGSRFTVQAGLSSNKQLIRYRRNSDPGMKDFQHSNTEALPAPRFSLLYKLSKTVSAYAVLARGFSPPTLAEIRPSDGNFYTLQPENGWNREIGIKGFALKARLEFDASYYYFSLKEALVRRLNDAGAEYFVNAGSTLQKGVEVWLRAHLVNNRQGFIRHLVVGNSTSYQPYTFKNYTVDATDFSGNRLTGVPRNVNVTTLDVETNRNFYSSFTLNMTGKIPLTDANNVYADSYKLLQVKLGYKKQMKAVMLDVFGTLDNALNQLYSLGNDINAFGGRYFNLAARRNFTLGIVVKR